MPELPASVFVPDHQSDEPGAAPGLTPLAGASDLVLANLLGFGFGDTGEKREAPRPGARSWTAPDVMDLAGRIPGYEVARMLGRGGMGAVCEARHLIYAMEFVEGEDLAARLSREPAPTIEESVAILQTICRAPTLLHRNGVAHRDVKPANVLLARGRGT